VRLQPESAVALDGLASAYAATRRFDQAALTARQAIARAIATKNAALQTETDIGLR